MMFEAFQNNGRPWFWSRILKQQQNKLEIVAACHVLVVGYVGAFQNNEHGLGQSSNNNKTKLDIL